MPSEPTVDAAGTPVAAGSVAPSVDLSGKVAVVTGASRSIGKGIALELGAAGATVYVTGRTVDPGALPGTIGETAAQIDALGGHGVAVACDVGDALWYLEMIRTRQSVAAIRSQMMFGRSFIPKEAA